LTVQQTSLHAYHTTPHFAPTQRSHILKTVEKNGNMTNREIQHETGIIISSVSARVHELRVRFHLLELAKLFDDGLNKVEDDVYVYRCSKNGVVHRIAKIDGGNEVYRRHGFTEHPKKVDANQTKLLVGVGE